jgi:hypothetical protein
MNLAKQSTGAAQLFMGCQVALTLCFYAVPDGKPLRILLDVALEALSRQEFNSAETPRV